MSQPTEMILTTVVSPFGPTRTEQLASRLLTKGADMGLRHLLLIDYTPGGSCTCSTGAQGYLEHNCIVQSNGELDTRPGFLDRVRKVARLDWQEQDVTPRIDAVVLHKFPCGDSPSHVLIRALRGLHPRLLHVDCGWDETCDLGNLAALDVRWPLEVMELVNVSSGDWAPPPDEYFARYIHTVHLHYCCSLGFRRVGPPVALRHLTITENDALNMLCDVGQETRMLEGLESLRVTSTHGLDFQSSARVEDVLEVLEALGNLRLLELTLGAWVCYDEEYMDFVDLPHHLPQCLQVFKLSAPPGLVPRTETWIEKINDENWLPELEEFSLHLDQTSNPGGQAAWDREQRALAVGRKKAKKIGREMRTVRPGVRVDVLA